MYRKGKALLNVQLEPDVLKQDEVVVTGLASSVKRRNLATAVAKVSDELNGSPSQSLDQALENLQVFIFVEILVHSVV